MEVANCDRFNILKHSSTSPYAFTEQSVAMLASVLKSDPNDVICRLTAVKSKKTESAPPLT